MKVKLRPQNVFDLILPRFPRIECKQSIPNAESRYSGVHMSSAKQYGSGRQPWFFNVFKEVFFKKYPSVRTEKLHNIDQGKM